MRIVPLLLSAVLLGAHFYRAGDTALALAVLAAPLMLLVKKPWAVTALQIALFAGAAEWVRTAVRIGAVREAMGQPSLRMFVILGAVAVFTALSAIPLRPAVR